MSGTATDLAAPPVPPDADLTDFRFMPLEVARLRRSKAWLICKRRPELAFYMLNLWTAAWHERPAGSLEDDNDVLADAAMCSPARWAKVRDHVMRGWFKASDGRLYHMVVAEKVIDSWHGKTVARWRKECDRIRKDNGRRKEKDLPPLDLPPEPVRTTSVLPADEPDLSGGHPADAQGTTDGIPAENALKGEGEEREREGKGDSSSEPNGSGAGAPPSDLASKLFGEGVDWLQVKTGKTNGACRQLVGRWRKDLRNDDGALIGILADAQRRAIEHPESWIATAIKHRSASHSAPRVPPELA